MGLRRSGPAAAVFLVSVVLAGPGVLPANRIQPSEPRPLDRTEPITYFIANGTAKSGFRASDRELALWAVGAWQRIAGDRLRFLPAPEPMALIRVYWAEHVSGRYTEMQPTRVEGRRGAALFVPPDMQALGPDVARLAAEDPLMREAMVYLTCLHQIGHGLGLPHSLQKRDLMYVFGDGRDIAEYLRSYRAQLRTRSDIATTPGVSDADVDRFRAIYDVR
jgi:hypothetical protein